MIQSAKFLTFLFFFFFQAWATLFSHIEHNKVALQAIINPVAICGQQNRPIRGHTHKCRNISAFAETTENARVDTKSSNSQHVDWSMLKAFRNKVSPNAGRLSSLANETDDEQRMTMTRLRSATSVIGEVGCVLHSTIYWCKLEHFLCSKLNGSQHSK